MLDYARVPSMPYGMCVCAHVYVRHISVVHLMCVHSSQYTYYDCEVVWLLAYRQCPTSMVWCVRYKVLVLVVPYSAQQHGLLCEVDSEEEEDKEELCDPFFAHCKAHADKDMTKRKVHT